MSFSRCPSYPCTLGWICEKGVYSFSIVTSSFLFRVLHSWYEHGAEYSMDDFVHSLDCHDDNNNTFYLFSATATSNEKCS